MYTVAATTSALVPTQAASCRVKNKVMITVTNITDRPSIILPWWHIHQLVSQSVDEFFFKSPKIDNLGSLSNTY